MLSALHLVYPPVSSFEADSVKADPQVEALLRTSDFYVMAMRPEVVFDQHIQIDGAVWTVPVLGQTPGGEPMPDEVTLDIARFATDLLGEAPESITAEAGPKMLRFWAGTLEDLEEDRLDGPFEWFTTEKLLHDKGRGVDGIIGLDRHRDFARYELLYVGIAKKTDTFDRLFERAHHARQKILSGEWPRRSGHGCPMS